MKTVALLVFMIFLNIDAIAQSDLKLWYDKPAKEWVEALPVGNGKIGAMIFGGVEDELLQLNESTLWSGGPVKTNVNPEAPSYLPQIREALLRDKDYSRANTLAKKMQGLYTESFLPLGDVTIHQAFNGAAVTDYYRDLDISTAIATTRFTVNGVIFQREIFTSAHDNILVMRFTSSKPAMLRFDISARSYYDTISVQAATTNYWYQEKRLRMWIPVTITHAAASTWYTKTVPVAMVCVINTG